MTRPRPQPTTLICPSKPPMTPQDLRATLLRYQPLIDMTKAHRYRLREAVDKPWEWAEGCTSTIGHANKPALMDWAARLAAASGDPKAHIKAREKAAGGGTDVHALIERDLRQRLGEPVAPEIDASDEVLLAYAKWATWAKAVDLTPLVVEVRVASFANRVAGTLDFLGFIRGELAVADWKTGGIYAEAHLQSAAYRAFVREMTGETLPGVLVHIPKDGSDVVDQPATADLEGSYDAFLSLLKYGRWLKDFKRTA